MNSIPQFVFSAILLGLSWVFSGVVTYGFMKAKIFDFERRLLALENSGATNVTLREHEARVTEVNTAISKKLDRTEYDARHQDIVRQLDRIEGKLDRTKTNL